MLCPLKIHATARAVPPRVLTNAELEAMVDTSDSWIRERTGIRERHIAAADVATSDLAAEALVKACAAADLDPASLDAIIVATSTADTLFPSTACWLQHKLGLRGPAAFDVSAGCSGFLYGLEVAAAPPARPRPRRPRRGDRRRGHEQGRRLDRPQHLRAVRRRRRRGILGPGDGTTGVLGSAWGADGTLAPVLYQPAGGTRMPASQESVAAMAHTVHMEGNLVFKHAVTAMSEAAIQAMARAGLPPTTSNLLIPHQANTRIMEAARARTGIPADRMLSIVERYGNICSCDPRAAACTSCRPGAPSSSPCSAALRRRHARPTVDAAMASPTSPRSPTPAASSSACPPTSAPASAAAPTSARRRSAAPCSPTCPTGARLAAGRGVVDIGDVFCVPQLLQRRPAGAPARGHPARALPGYAAARALPVVAAVDRRARARPRLRPSTRPSRRS
jgi:3-oxoacyl-[acyl-carrier-protein] synthase-3